MNKVIFMGRLVADPEFSMSQTGMPICRFRIAVDRIARQGEQRQSDFFRITCFGKTAEFVNQYFVKGKPILVEGRIQNNNYTDQSGVQHYQDQIIADNVSFLLSDPTRTNNGQSYGSGYNNNGYQSSNYGNNSNGYQNNNYGYNNNNGYQNNNYSYGNNNYNNGGNNYQQSAPQNPVPQQPANPPKDVQLGDSDISDFEEIISDGQVPF